MLDLRTVESLCVFSWQRIHFGQFGDERVSSLPMVVLMYRYKWDHTNITYDLALSKCFRSEMQDRSKDYRSETRECREEMDVERKSESL